jgi:hypothetical protein
MAEHANDLPNKISSDGDQGSKNRNLQQCRTPRRLHQFFDMGQFPTLSQNHEVRTLGRNASIRSDDDDGNLNGGLTWLPLTRATAIFWRRCHHAFASLDCLAGFAISKALEYWKAGEDDFFPVALNIFTTRRRPGGPVLQSVSVQQRGEVGQKLSTSLRGAKQ